MQLYLSFCITGILNHTLPSCPTGYMISRVLGAAPLVADTIIDQLCSVSDRAQDRNTPRAPRSEEEADAMAAAVWAALWPKRRQRQREFFWFGMEVRREGVW